MYLEGITFPFLIHSESVLCDQIIYVFISPHPPALLNPLSSLNPKYDELGKRPVFLMKIHSVVQGRSKVLPSESTALQCKFNCIVQQHRLH